MPPKKRQSKHLRKARNDKKVKVDTVHVDPHLIIYEDEEFINSDKAEFIPSDESLQELILAELKWKPGGGGQFRSPYTGDTRSTYYRRVANQKLKLKAAQGYKPISSYFPLIDRSPITQTNTPEIPKEVEKTVELKIKKAVSDLQCMIQETNNQSSERRNNDITKFNFLRFIAIKRYFGLLLICPRSKLESSLDVAKALFPERNVSYYSRRIRFWADYYLENNGLPESSQGKFVKVSSLCSDEDVRLHCLEWLRGQKGDFISGSTFRSWVNNNLHTKLGLKSPFSLSKPTAIAWLKKLDYQFNPKKKGIYVDGHERSDVVEYRSEFLARMEGFSKKMIIYEGERMEQEILPNLEEGEKIIVPVVHDESFFNSNDGKNSIWSELGNQPIQSKGKGKGLMVSEFLCECHGRMSLDADKIARHPNIPSSTVEIIDPSNLNGYWDNKDLIKQIKSKSVPIFRILHPNMKCLLLFDNSSNHKAMADDALVAQRMNLKDAGKNALKMRSTYYLRNGEAIEQLMVLDDGSSKGLKRVLEERGLWPDEGLKLNEARELLRKQPDFFSQRPILEEEILKEEDFDLLFFPKFHCEFNHIEMFWGACKRYTRENCGYSFKELKRIVPLALDSVELESIRKFARKSWRYMDAYMLKNGTRLTMKQAEFAVKLYKSHRRIPESIFESLI